jgi:uncharacterized repeat protein (TIGR01451 family)
LSEQPDAGHLASRTVRPDLHEQTFESAFELRCTSRIQGGKMRYRAPSPLIVLLLTVVAVLIPAVTLAQQTEKEISATETSPPPKAIKEEAPPDLEPDPRQPMASWPGPDGSSYGGSICTYNWLGITGAATSVALGDDSFAGPFDIGFSFPFYGNNYDQFYVDSNGFLSFDPLSSSYLSNSCPLPDSFLPNNLVALMWDDLDPGDTSDLIYYESFASCPVGSGRCLVVLYDDFCFYPGGATCTKAGTFEAILYQDGTVLIQFQDAGERRGASSTTGIEGENAGSDHGLVYACNSTVLSDSLCLQFRRLEIPNLTTSNKTTGSMPVTGGLITYTVSVVNSGAGTAANTSLIDPIPANATFAYVVSPPSLVYNSAEDRVEWAGSVPPDTQIDLTFAVTATGGCGDEIINTGIISSPDIPNLVTVQHTTSVWDMVYYSEDLEGDDGGYMVEGIYPTWQWGTPSSGPDGAHSGSGAWATNLEGNYNNFENSSLTSPAIDLGGSTNVPGSPLWLEWWDWFQSELCCDYGIVEARGGGMGWTPLTDQFRGYLGGWTKHVVDISEFSGAADFQIRFHLSSDYSVTREGWYLDDIAIYQCTPPPGLYLTPGTIETSGCGGLAQPHDFSLSNLTGTGGTFDLTYSLANSSRGTIEGPTSLVLANGAHASFVVTVTPEVCVPSNTQLIATVTAGGNGYVETSHLTKTIVTGLYPEWLRAADTPQGTRFHAVAYHQGSLYQIGGETNWWQPTNAVYRHDVANDAWNAVAPLPTGRYGMDAVTIGDRIYVPGGSDRQTDSGAGGPFLDDLLVYDPASNSWFSAAPMPQARAYASAVAHDGKLYVIGGEDDDADYTNTLYIYDPRTDDWSTGAPMSEGRGYAAAAAVGAKIYVAGGFAGGSNVHDSTEIYDPATNSWSAGPSLPTRWAPFGDAALSDRYFAVYSGGEISYDPYDGTGYTCSPDAYYLDTQTRQWIALPALNRCLYGSQGVAAGNRLYLVSGRTNAGYYWQMAPEVEYMQSCPTCTDLGWLDGHVYDYDMARGVCTDATVHAEPGNADVPVAASGYYTATMVPFDYTVTASAEGYPNTDGPYAVSVSAGAISSQDFVLGRPDISVDPLALNARAVAPQAVTQHFTITNRGPYALEFEIHKVATPSTTGAASKPLAAPGEETKSQPLTGGLEIEVEPKLLSELDADEANGYLIYFRERPDLSPAFEMDWIERGRFVVRALQETADRSQERVRAYLDAQGVAYQAFWIDNVISVRSSNRAAFAGLLEFPEIEALLARRHPILHEQGERSMPSLSPTGIEPNISHVGADQVWTEMGITGQGIVVANIDTGVRYTHEALSSQYRGNLGGGSFDHNHNWWDPAPGGSDLVPNDWHSHGSHTMGTMLGTDGGANQIGMAPEATWIACQAFEYTDDELLECGQFMAAPWDLTGANADPDLRPHVVNNSWGDCGQAADHWYDGVIDAWHALGIYPVFSAGNASNCSYTSPPGCNTVGNPARSGHVTGVGSTGRDDGQYASHSNWGPTDDPDDVNPNGYPTLKPQVLAPGVNIRSSLNSGDAQYDTKSGTSMSAPHVSGLVALMWSAAPCLIGDYAATESIIQNTATPIPYASNCGGEGPSNIPNMAAGWGEINAYAAVSAAREHCGTDWTSLVETDIVTGTLEAGQDQPVEVTFTCIPEATQEPQPLQGTLRIVHNDPCQEPVDVQFSFFCVSQTPNPTWKKKILINDIQTETTEGPHVVRPGDTVIVVDQVGAVVAEPVTSSLTETWSNALALINYDSGGDGRVSEGDHTLTWDLENVAPNTLYPITKTFEVQYGDWTTGMLTERYNVQGAIQQPADVVVSFQRYGPAMRLTKDGPATSLDGEVAMLTLTILSEGNFRDRVVLTDTLPPGMTYMGDLTSTYGLVQEETNTIYWSSSGADPLLNAPLQSHVGVLSPDTDPLQDLVDLLNGMGGITAQRIVGDLSAMTPEDLEPYQVIVTTNNNKWSNAGGNPNIGNILADYVDAGGKLIMADFAWDSATYGWQLAGRLMDEGYTPYLNSTVDLGSASLGDYDPAHPVMQGVTGLSAVGTVSRQALPLRDGASWIADWNDGQPCVYAQGTSVLGYNFLLDWSGDGWPWSGDVPILLENSVNWLVSHIPPPMPPKVTISFLVEITGETGDVIRNSAYLDWGSDWTSAAHDVLLSEAPDTYLPLIYRP